MYGLHQPQKSEAAAHLPGLLQQQPVGGAGLAAGAALEARILQVLQVLSIPLQPARGQHLHIPSVVECHRTVIQKGSKREADCGG
jgi:hypothetical protein